MDGTLTGILTLYKSRVGSSGSEEILHIPKRSQAGAALPDAF